MRDVIQKIFNIFEKNNQQIFLVGGIVRDKLLNIESNDIDFATSAPPENSIKIVKSEGLSVFEIGIEFGTIQTLIDSEKVEITTFRCKESYTKGSRKPGVVFGKTIEEDLIRRDFSINSIAMDKNGNFIDPFGGIEDIKNKIIRTPGDPDISFGDDPLRMLRAARFAAKLDFNIEKLTFESIKRNKEKIHNISVERIFEEMTKLLMCKDPTKGLKVLEDTGLMGQIFPEIQEVIEFKEEQGKFHHKDVWGHIVEVVKNSEQIEEVRWSALMHDIGKVKTRFVNKTGIHFYGHDLEGAKIWDKIAERLKTSKDFKETIHFLIEHHMEPSLLSKETISEKAARRFVNRAGKNLNNLFKLSFADITSHHPEIVEEGQKRCLQLKQRVEKLSTIEEVINPKLPHGLGLKISEAANRKPGPWLGGIMQKLHQKLIDGDLNKDSDFIAEALNILNIQQN